MSSDKTISYEFSEEEFKALALFLRQISNDIQIPYTLSSLVKYTENYIYSQMTIEEAVRFFNGQ